MRALTNATLETPTRQFQFLSLVCVSYATLQLQQQKHHSASSKHSGLSVATAGLTPHSPPSLLPGSQTDLGRPFIRSCRPHAHHQEGQTQASPQGPARSDFGRHLWSPLHSLSPTWSPTTATLWVSYTLDSPCSCPLCAPCSGRALSVNPFALH